MRDLEMRTRVDRLLAGECRPDDLTRLFLYLRERSFGIASIREVGDFVAHSTERDKGLTTQESHEFFAAVRLQTQHWNKPIDPANLPPNFANVVQTNFSRLDAEIIKRDTGLTKKSAGVAIRTALAKLGTKPDGQLFQRVSFTPEEAAIVKCSTRSAVYRPAFNEASLLRDFSNVLEKNKLLDASQRKNTKRLGPFLALFAMTAMHQTQLVLNSSGWRASLEAGATDGKLVVWADTKCPILDQPDKWIRVIVPMFTTTLDVADWCDPSLTTVNGEATWTVPLELAVGPKLVPLG